MAATNHPKWIVWHTAGPEDDDGNPINIDQSVETIDKYHRGLGWDSIGYHYWIRMDGRVETGRNESMHGAHVPGLNEKSIGICFAGHGDLAPFSEAQMRSGLNLTRDLMKRYDIARSRVIGHREINALVAQGIVSNAYATDKTCPGKLIDMDEIRKLLGGAVERGR